LAAFALITNPNEFQDALGAALFFPVVIPLAAGPAWSFLAYCSASIALLRRPRTERWRWKITDALLLTGWIAAAFAAWRKAMDMAIAEYATLPTDNPNCFICSAAAHGHVRFVRSETVQMGELQRCVTRQLRVFKAAELVLQATLPGLHGIVRRVYDGAGPCIARRVTNPWRADAVYLALKPAEWLAAISLRLLVGASHANLDRLYANREAN
jgi:hypothetical protein